MRAERQHIKIVQGARTSQGVAQTMTLAVLALHHRGAHTVALKNRWIDYKPNRATP